MSLLLQALQKAAKSREEGEVDAPVGTPAAARELALEPTSTSSPPPARQSAFSAPTSAQAATLVQAGGVPAFDFMDYAREHYMLTFVGTAFLFAAAYGAYVYLQMTRPFRSSAPAHVVAAGVPPAPPAVALAPSASAKVSGLPGGMTSPAVDTDVPAREMTTEPVAGKPGKAGPSAATALLDEPRTSAPKASRPNPGKAVSPATVKQPDRTQSPPLVDASDSIETVVIPTSRAQPWSDISVRHDEAGVAPVNPNLMQAYEALQSGDYARAKVSYEQVLQAEPRNLDALLGLAAIALNTGHLDDASRHYEQVLELDPRNSYAQAGLISIIGGADPQASESRLKLLIARDPSAFLYFALGNLYAEQGQWPFAQQAYFQAYQMQQDNPDYAFNLAIGLEHLGQDRLALDYYRKALQLSFKKGHANFDQSLVIQRVGQLSIRVER